METIGQALIKSSEQQSSRNLPATTQRLSPAVLQKTRRVIERYGDKQNFMLTFNPSVQKLAGRRPERAFFGEAPSLAIMRQTYGDGFPGTWLLPQILDLVAFSNSKGTLSGEQAEFLAEAIANEYYYLKASELMLFFYRFKCGTYGKFYGNVDPMMIMQGLKQFMKERAVEIERHENEKMSKERDETAKNAITPREYCRNHGYPEMDNVLDIIEYERKLENVKPPKD